MFPGQAPSFHLQLNDADANIHFVSWLSFAVLFELFHLMNPDGSGPPLFAGPTEKAYQALLKWMRRLGEKAAPHALVLTFREHSYKHLAGTVHIRAIAAFSFKCVQSVLLTETLYPST